jgi:hypothetical protein
MFFTKLIRNLDSTVGVVSGYGLQDREVGVGVLVGSGIFSTSSRPVVGPTQPPIVDTRDKAAGREACHSHLTSAEVKKMWIYISTPVYAFIA